MSAPRRMRAALAGLTAAGLVAGAVAVQGDSGASPASGPRSAPVAGGSAQQAGRAAHGPRSPSSAVVVRPPARHEGFLTGPSSADPARVALRFVSRNSAALRLRAEDLRGLEPNGRYRSGGITYLSWKQTYRGIPAVDGGLRAAVARNGRLLALPSVPVPRLAPASTEPRLSAAAATGVAARAVGAPGPGSFENGTRATLAVFGEPGAGRLAWRVLLVGGGGWDVVVDAESGAVLRTRGLTREATGIIHQNYPGAPVGGADQTVSLDPWLSPGNRLNSLNTHVYADPADDYEPGDTVQTADEITSTGGNWNYAPNRMTISGQQTCPPSRCTWDYGNGLFNWTVNRSQAATQLFWFVNRFHDHLRDAAGIGFGGSSPGSLEGNDAVLAQVDDGSTTGGAASPNCQHVNNAGMTVYPDGFPAKLETYLWTAACGETGVYDVNGADDPYVVFHEYTHGMSLRLVHDNGGVGALNDPQAGAMGEAWSDWYAEDYLVAAGLQGDTATPGELRAGPYLGAARLRTQPFDCPVAPAGGPCPGTTGAGPGGYTYGDFGRIIDEPEVHADGEIWAETLWDLRRALVAKHPSDGVTRARGLITDGMRLTPPEPSFLQGRDAILQSNVSRGYGDRDLIWAVFAARGMGLNAGTTGGADTTPVAGFAVPPPLPAPPAPGGNVVPLGDTVAPRVSRFGVSRRSFRVGSSSTPRSAARRVAVGTRFRFRLSERAKVTIVLSRALAGRRVGRTCRRPTHALRRHARCTRSVGAGRLARSGQLAGAAWVRFSGRVGSRALAPGSYRAALTARDAAGNRSRAVATRFTVVRPQRSRGA